MLSTYTRMLQPTSSIGRLQGAWAHIELALPLLAGCEPIELSEERLLIECDDGVVGEELRMMGDDVLAIIDALAPDLSVGGLRLDVRLRRG
ncbi:MAG TPA: hypothetical protein VKU89_02070 [Solirubrobacteraceae bacterium]|nr:hypothetical protein [Solirubrobacteraceae bacterium]